MYNDAYIIIFMIKHRFIITILLPILFNVVILKQLKTMAKTHVLHE